MPKLQIRELWEQYGNQLSLKQNFGREVGQKNKIKHNQASKVLETAADKAGDLIALETVQVYGTLSFAT